MGETVLVLGGGGLTGIAWMTGLLFGMAGVVDVARFDRVIGTSAGAAVGAQLGGGLPLGELFERQVDPAKQVAEIAPELGQLAALLRDWAAAATIPDAGERHRRIGRLALDARTVPEEARRAVIMARLPSHEWPARPLQLTALDAETGAFCAFDAASGVPLVDAVAASCAVPGIWPPVSIAGRRYVDGGVRSAENADLAAGAAKVVILSPAGRTGLAGAAPTLPREIETLEAAGAHVHAIEPSDAVRAVMGANALDPAVRAPTAKAGLEQGQQEASALAAFLAA